MAEAAAADYSVAHFEERRTDTAPITQAMRDHPAHTDRLYAQGDGPAS
jgi:hypothetical protein